LPNSIFEEFDLFTSAKSNFLKIKRSVNLSKHGIFTEISGHFCLNLQSTAIYHYFLLISANRKPLIEKLQRLAVNKRKAEKS